MSLLIKGDEIDQLANEAKKLLGAESKADAVRSALKSVIDSRKKSIPLADRVRPLQEQYLRILASKDADNFDMKDYMNEEEKI
ncbi:type II toxin-antitoxin system VapB family antitoxin [Allorhizobium sp. BGMRC 0089]|uniref:type II toxin-antitoxin system VapB family antitoxin n=1 Tax=Allorhizobium sonneratiae TaxID=2934936 RepID=UPI0020338CD8|nr:type II toxin-antitoxin system VapB family antitoxin [Allorhizobium sonneratiae]MCM2294790.1 type II toxin-antitoxin system VapB family antitoxin [Allorhizobium sonneratiae]